MPAPPTIHGPGELIAALPALLGFTPRESVVIVGVGASDALVTVLRVDRADLLEPRAGTLARAVAAELSRGRARLAVLVSYTDHDVRVGCPAIDALRPALGEAVEEAEGWAVTRGRYFAPGCARESCCPAAGRPVPPTPAGLAARPRIRAGAHGALASAPDAAYLVDEAARKRVARAAARWRARRDDDPGKWREASYAEWTRAVDGMRRDVVPSDPACGRLVEGLQDRRVRDAVLVSLMPGRSPASSTTLASKVLAGAGDAEVARALAVLLSPRDGLPPERDSVEPAWDLCGWLTARARSDRRAPMLTLCAVIAWWEGDQGACKDLLARAHASEPGYRLAGLLECTVLAGIDPGWRRAA